MADRRSLFLHVGLPKCAASALQDWAGTNRDLLAAQGITWPGTQDEGLMAARHHWLVATLRFGAPDRLAEVLSHASGDVLMSAEGLTRHFDEFPAERLAAFRAATAGWDVRVILMHRHIGAWQRSMWKQAMISPGDAAEEYGLALDLPDFAALPRMRRLADLAALRRDLTAGFGARDVAVIAADGDWLADLAGVLDVDLSRATTPPRRHESFADAAIPLVRAINAVSQDVRELRDPLLGLMQLALGSADDQLRTLAHRHGAAALAAPDTIGPLLKDLSAACRSEPGALWIVDGMGDLLAGAPAQERVA